jgi:hypothetical protein
MKMHFGRLYSLAVVGLLCVNPLAARADDVVLHWNDISSRTLMAQVPAVSPFGQARFSSIVQLAVFEAVNATTGGRYASYLGSPMAPTGAPIVAAIGASADAAAIAAAHAVLVNYLPASTAVLDAERDASLAAIPDSAAKTDGIAAGLAAAAALIAQRVGDGSSPAVFYHPPSPTLPGQYDVTLPPLGACGVDASGNPLGSVLLNWKDVKPFGFVQPGSGHWTDDYRPAPPPAITSNLYANHYNEVKRVGSVTSTERPDDRALVVRFYGALSPTYLFNMVARQLAEARGDSLAENARTLALVSMATNDSLIASFEAKYHYLYWRPATAIRGGDTDDNQRTVADAEWAPFILTPCFPSYPSNHASGSNAGLEVIRRIFGTSGHAIALSGTIPAIGPVTLNYTKLKDISNDIDDARVYGGIHYRFDQDAGVRLGQRVASAVVKGNLRRVKH